jgi:hypothetical protein
MSEAQENESLPCSETEPKEQHPLKEEVILESYLSQELIRIDNQDASSPFAIFFVLCLVMALSLFSFSGSVEPANPRLLANYHSALTQLIAQQDAKPHTLTPTPIPPEPNYFEITSHRPKSKAENLTDQFPTLFSSVLQPLPNLRGHLSAPQNKSWKKIGNYICS